MSVNVCNYVHKALGSSGRYVSTGDCWGLVGLGSWAQNYFMILEKRNSVITECNEIASVGEGNRLAPRELMGETAQKSKLEIKRTTSSRKAILGQHLT